MHTFRAWPILYTQRWGVLYFNEYFSSVFTKEDLSSIPTCANKPLPFFHISEIDITEDMVKSKLKRLRPDKAGGADNLLPRLLVSIQQEISYPL